jgi:hypothetical protein
MIEAWNRPLIQNFCRKLSGRDNFIELHVDGRIILILIGNLIEIVCEGVDWIYLPQGRVQWRDIENTVMNLRVP